MAVNLLVELQT